MIPAAEIVGRSFGHLTFHLLDQLPSSELPLTEAAKRFSFYPGYGKTTFLTNLKHAFRIILAPKIACSDEAAIFLIFENP